jgi:hypothetical protein
VITTFECWQEFAEFNENAPIIRAQLFSVNNEIMPEETKMASHFGRNALRVTGVVKYQLWSAVDNESELLCLRKKLPRVFSGIA